MSDVDVLAMASIVMADEEKIRADERRKFAENLKEEIYEYLMEHYESRLSYIAITRIINGALTEYEKEKKND